ncbi:MAG: sugar ABC transporter permease [Elusimicrobia bacterium]|nr:sugar ABC transporter permease [Elusimicrobiota bacterium]
MRDRGILFILPLLAFVAAFIIVPICGAFWNSAFQDIGYLQTRFVGLGNYRQALSDPAFRQSLKFTIIFIAVSVPLELALGLAFALILDLDLPFRGALRACVLLPWAIPTAISARVWELIYGYGYGLANALWTGLGCGGPVNWLGTPWRAFGSLVAAEAWKTTPFVTIILLAGLSAIPRDLYSQAKVDRANSLQIFWRITLPLLRPAMLVALLFRTIDALRVFDVIYVLTHGGPGGSTTSLSLYAYKYFLNGDFGYGSAISVALFLVAFAFSLAYVRLAGYCRALA